MKRFDAIAKSIGDIILPEPKVDQQAETTSQAGWLQLFFLTGFSPRILCQKMLKSRYHMLQKQFVQRFFEMLSQLNKKLIGGIIPI